MLENFNNRSKQILFKGEPGDKHYLILLLLITLLISYPFFSILLPFSHTLYGILACIFVIYGVMLINKPGTSMIISGIAAVIVILSEFAFSSNRQGSLLSYRNFLEAELIIFLIYFLLLGLRLLQDTLSVKVSARLLYISMQNYLIIGLIFNYLFRLVHIYQPDAFNFPADELGNYSYMSFIVLTSTGFGDLLPVSNAARILVVTEALAGQLYLTFFVALIVGKYLTEKSKN